MKRLGLYLIYILGYAVIAGLLVPYAIFGVIVAGLPEFLPFYEEQIIAFLNTSIEENLYWGLYFSCSIICVPLGALYGYSKAKNRVNEAVFTKDE